MADLDSTDLDLLELPGQAPHTLDVDAELAALFGESNENGATPAGPAEPPPLVVGPVTSPSVGPADARLVLPFTPHSFADYSWLSALHLVPEHEQLLLRYPAIALKRHTQYGLVLMAAYLADTERRIRRNLKLGNDLFFYAEELELTEPETKHLKCRIVIKTLPHRVGMRIRFWENGPQGDVVGKSGVYEVRAAGLQRISGFRGTTR
jgi:hypothetical protein